MSDLLRLTGVTVPRPGDRPLVALDLAMPAGRVDVVLGANGAGKSELLGAIMGLRPLAAGQIWFAGADITDVLPYRRARLGLGFCPEGRRLFPAMTVAETLTAASRGTAAARRRRREMILDLFPALVTRLETTAWRLSGGEQQMLAIGRAIAGGPRLLILDEPSLGLAPRVLGDIAAALGHLKADGTAILIAEQNARFALAQADHAWVLDQGQLVLSAPAAGLLEAPEVRRLMMGQ